MLVVEDDPLIQLIHKNFLTALNCIVDIVFNGEEALSIINNPYDLILLDIGLPGISGIETAAKIRQHEKNAYTKIVAITTNNKDDIKNSCLSVGINEILTKPITIEQIKILINKKTEL